MRRLKFSVLGTAHGTRRLSAVWSSENSGWKRIWFAKHRYEVLSLSKFYRACDTLLDLWTINWDYEVRCTGSSTVTNLLRFESSLTHWTEMLSCLWNSKFPSLPLYSILVSSKPSRILTKKISTHVTTAHVITYTPRWIFWKLTFIKIFWFRFIARWKSSFDWFFWWFSSQMPNCENPQSD